MSPTKKRQTMGKFTRERELRERRERKLEKKEGKKLAAAEGDAPVEDPFAVPLDDEPLDPPVE
ncbi:MAG: hypothetical protein WCH31_00805 [Actinomycetes bacterium]|jgi:hypothetical protein